MIAEIIDGRTIAEQRRYVLSGKIKSFVTANQSSISLHVILVGEHAASQIYVRNKQKACQTVGIESVLHHLPESTTQEALISLIEKLNKDKSVNGILLQLPLPQHLEVQKTLESIDPEKDVDGLHPYNLGRLLMGKPLLVPCTPQGCLQLIQSVCPNLAGKTAVIVGRSLLVGKSLGALLTNSDVTVTLAHSKTQNLKDICKKADILVCAIGAPQFFTKEYVKPGAVVIDVGINRITESDGSLSITGDVDFSSVKEVAAFLTPVPKGVGPMTIANLLENTFKAAQHQYTLLTTPK